jgi:putative peptidoglycan lipid II flippase
MLTMLKASLRVGLATAVVGVATLLQDVTLASRFATGPEIDAYQLAMLLPMLGINIFAGGTLQAVLVPALVRAELDHGHGGAAQLVGLARARLARMLAVTSLPMALLFMLALPAVSGGLSPETLRLASTLFWIVLPSFFLAGLASFHAAVLNGIKAFVLAALMPATMPLTVIVGVLLLSGELGAPAIAWGALLGSALQCALAWHVVRRRGFARASAASDPAGYAMALPGYWPMVTAAALLGGVLLTDVALAAGMPTGSVATFGYATRPILLGLAFATVVTGNVALPHFSRLAAKGEGAALRRAFLQWVGLLLALSTPLTLLCAFYAGEITALLYQRDAFGADESVRVAEVLAVFALQAPFYLTAMIGWRVANALGAHRAMSRIALGCFLLNGLLGFAMGGIWGLVGVAAATVATYLLWSVLVSGFILRACRARPECHANGMMRHES